MIKKVIIILALCSGVSFAQYKNIKINTLENRPNEVSIAINPLDPMNIIAGANLDNYYYSMDGGVTWENKSIKSDESGVWGDPCLFYDAKGNAYFIHLARPPENGKWLDRIVCQKSLDNGMTYNNPGTFTGLNPLKIQDKAWAIADWTNSKYRNNIYVSWTQFDKYESRNPLDSSIILFSYSNDGGMTWSEGKRINQVSGDCLDSSNTVEGAVPCVGPNGEVYDAWAGPLGLVFDKSLDGGITWAGNKTITQLIGGWTYDILGIYRCNGMPITCCDISTSPYKGNIYINWSDGRNGINDVDIFLIKSSDGGSTWSNIKRVNDDKEKNGKQQFMSYMSVDPVTGNIYILYFDRRVYNDNETDVYLARSTDGGESFANMKISEKPFTPESKVFFGDYIGISAYNDFAACLWQRVDGGTTNIQFCGVDFKK